MRIALAILNWNGQHLLEKFLPSVVEYSRNKADVYVIDNASSDNSIDLLKVKFPIVKIVELPKNLGFAGGYNEGLKCIHADIYCLLNNDVEVSPRWLDPIITAFNNASETVIIQPKILNQINRSQFDYAGAGGGFIDKYGFPYCRGRIFDAIEEDNGQFDDEQDIFWASGACLFIRSNTFTELGGFDERFFAHMEEIDLCWRAFNRGLSIKYVGSSVVYHVGGATLNQINPRKTYLNFKNSLLMLVKNLPKGKLFTTVFIRLFLDGIAAIKFLFEGKPKHTWAVLHAHFSFYMQLFNYLKERKGKQGSNKYYKIASIVWAYFVNKKRTFNSL